MWDQASTFSVRPDFTHLCDTTEFTLIHVGPVLKALRHHAKRLFSTATVLMPVV
jgi:hypothetical protein